MIPRAKLTPGLRVDVQAATNTGTSHKIKTGIERKRQRAAALPRRLSFSRFLNFGDGGTKVCQNPVHFIRTRVPVPRPEEAFEAITFAARHDMEMKMGDALAYVIVRADEGPFGAHGLLDRTGKHLHSREKWFVQRFRQIGDGLEMTFGNKQAVTRKERAMIQKSERVLVLENATAFRFAQ
jgi:hypothetical protein